MYDQLYIYMNNFLKELLCGFRKAHSTQHALFKLLQAWQKEQDNSGFIGTILVVLSKAQWLFNSRSNNCTFTWLSEITPVRCLRACHMWLTRNHMFSREIWGKYTSLIFEILISPSFNSGDFKISKKWIR